MRPFQENNYHQPMKLFHLKTSVNLCQALIVQEFETVPGEQLPPTNETVPPENVSQLVSGVNETVPGEQLPPTNETVPPENVSQLPTGSPSPTTSGAEPLCSDGLPPDANGLCADGLPPTAVNVTASPDVASSYTLVP